MTFKSMISAGAAVMALMVPLSARAETTYVSVRVLAEQAKFIGSSMGGMKVVLTNAETGEVLSEGVTAGGTGDTKLIMSDGLNRYQTRWSPGAAEFRAELDLDRPVKLRAEVTGPLGHPENMASASAEQWVVPGKHVTGGDAFELELPGFVIDIAAAPTGEVQAEIVMMCGCTIMPGGLWDADKLEIAAIVYQDGDKLGEIPMSYAGTPNHFHGNAEGLAPGSYEIEIYAYDESSGNTGLSHGSLTVE